MGNASDYLLRYIKRNTKYFLVYSCFSQEAEVISE